MSEYVVFIIWFVSAIILSGLLVIAKTRGQRAALIILINLLFAFYAFKDRFELYTPIASLPNPVVEYAYIHHKTKPTDDGSFDVILWLSRVDNGVEEIFRFPYIGNEQMKKDLDRLRKLSQDGKMGVGPFKFTKDPKLNDVDQSVFPFTTIVRNPDSYNLLLKDAPK